MSANHHTPIAIGANADDTVFNAPLGQIDQTITDILDGTQEFTELSVNASLNAAAAVQVDSTTKGALWLPRMTEAQRDAIGSPPEGLLVYNSDDDAPNGYNGTSWVNYFPTGDDIQTIVAMTTFNASANIVLSSIPQIYQDLLLRLRVRSSQAGSASSILLMRFNSDSGASNYAWNWLANFNLAPGSRNDASDSEVELSCPGSTATAGRYLDLNILIRNYTEATNRIHGDFEGKGGHSIVSAMEDIWGAFEWVGGAAINRIDIIRSSSFAINGSYALYGLGQPE